MNPYYIGLISALSSAVLYIIGFIFAYRSGYHTGAQEMRDKIMYNIYPV